MTAEPFEFSDEAYDKARELMSELLTQAYNKDYPVAPVDDMLELLRPYIQQAIAAEYDRGYETALDMEIQPEKSVAWERGFADGAKHERSLWQWQAGSISRAVNGLKVRPEPPVNPYLHYPAVDGSVAPQTPPTTG